MPSKNSIEYLLIFAVLFFVVNSDEVLVQRHSPDTLSVVIQSQHNRPSTDHKSNAYVQIHEFPKVISQFCVVNTFYKCGSVKQFVIVELINNQYDERTVVAFRRKWMCKTTLSMKKKIKLKLPAKLAYKPSWKNQLSAVVKSSFLKISVVGNYEIMKAKEMNKPYYEYANSKASYPVTLKMPYERPSAPILDCLSWVEELKYSQPFSPVCDPEPEVISLVTFPVIASGMGHGVFRQPQPYTDRQLVKQRELMILEPKFTLIFNLFILEYCTELSMCSIFQHLTWDDSYLTPFIMVTKHGNLYVQFTTEDGAAHSFLTKYELPKNKWFRLVAGYSKKMWHITLNSGENWEIMNYKKWRVATEKRVVFDDQTPILILGGSEVSNTFKGYFGKSTIFRNKFVPADEIPFVPKDDPMFLLTSLTKTAKCNKWLLWHDKFPRMHQLKQQASQGRSISIYTKLYQRHQRPNHCSASTIPDEVHPTVKQSFLTDLSMDSRELGRLSYNAVIQELRLGLEKLPLLLPSLEVSSCFGHHDATFLLSVIYENGIVVEHNPQKSWSFLMTCGLSSHRLCLLALAHKHTYGLDQFPRDFPSAYVYMKNVAMKTKRDLDDHASDGVFTEKVRLTDEAELENQKGEEGDVFQWVKYQAERGVHSAQHQIARQLFWGTKGVKRNIEKAVHYYEKGAESEDPVALYDYGIVLLKGQGVKQDTEKALDYLQRSAALGNELAFNTLGWYALEELGDYEKAALNLEEAYKLGSPDAAHNLGHMYMSGLHPACKGVSKREKAIEYFRKGALRGQLDSSLMVAIYNMRGSHDGDPDPELALTWARIIAEKNPSIGRILQNGLKSFHDKNWPMTALYYMMASTAGLEVASFNVAYICEQRKEDIKAFLQRDCMYRFFKLSSLKGRTNSYALVRLGNYYWYDGDEVDHFEASKYYVKAVMRGEAQALFNIALMVEDGVQLKPVVLDKLDISPRYIENQQELLLKLYGRCMKMSSESYMPCALAWMKVHLLKKWKILSNWTIAIAVLAISSFITMILCLCRLEPLDKVVKEVDANPGSTRLENSMANFRRQEQNVEKEQEFPRLKLSNNEETNVDEEDDTLKESNDQHKEKVNSQTLEINNEKSEKPEVENITCGTEFLKDQIRNRKKNGKCEEFSQ